MRSIVDLAPEAQQDLVESLGRLVVLPSSDREQRDAVERGRLAARIVDLPVDGQRRLVVRLRSLELAVIAVEITERDLGVRHPVLVAAQRVEALGLLERSGSCLGLADAALGEPEL